MAEPLSPAAQKVRHVAICAGPELEGRIAAALRAAADEVVPEEPLHGGDQRWMYERDARQDTRRKFLAIAAELESFAE